MREPREHQTLQVSSFLFADKSQLMLRSSNVNSVLLWFISVAEICPLGKQPIK